MVPVRAGGAKRTHRLRVARQCRRALRAPSENMQLRARQRVAEDERGRDSKLYDKGGFRVFMSRLK